MYICILILVDWHFKINSKIKSFSSADYFFLFYRDLRSMISRVIVFKARLLCKQSVKHNARGIQSCVHTGLINFAEYRWNRYGLIDKFQVWHFWFCILKGYLCNVKLHPYKHFSLFCLYILVCFSVHLCWICHSGIMRAQAEVEVK